jgi:ArsR family transcriptional regulator
MSSDPVAFGKAIADETRQKIMKLLCCRELCVSDVVAELGDITQPTVSHHLHILKSAGLVDTRRQGKQIYYTLRQEAVANCCLVIAQRYAPEIDLLDTEMSGTT